MIREHLACTVVMSDARLSGELSANLTVQFSPDSSSAGTWTGVFVLTNPGGRWDGAGRGAASRAPDGGAPGLYGRVTFRGSGAYAGLLSTQLFAGDAVPEVMAGWISGTMEPASYARLAQIPSLWVDAITLAAASDWATAEVRRAGQAARTQPACLLAARMVGPARIGNAAVIADEDLAHRDLIRARLQTPASRRQAAC